MSYRKIMVDGVQYEYAVGKTATKINVVKEKKSTLGVFDNATFAKPIVHHVANGDDIVTFTVQPKHIRMLIENKIKGE